MTNFDAIENILREHLESVMLKESVREWMVIVKSGLLQNKRVVYSSDKKSKAEEIYLDYRDRYPDYQFKVMTKTAFRDAYHRFPEYVPEDVKEKMFGKEKKTKINPDFKKDVLVYDPEDVQVRVHPKVTIDQEVQQSVPKPSVKKYKIDRFN